MRNQDIAIPAPCPQTPGCIAPVLDDSERETVITWTDADNGRAHVFTCQPPMVRLLRKHPQARQLTEHRSERGELTAVEYELPVACLAIFIRPRASTWERMLRTGPKGRRPRQRSLDSVQNPQSDLCSAGPGRWRP